MPPRGEASDRAGNQEPAKQLVVRIDSVAPVITGLPAGCVLWPPNHALVEVADVQTADPLSGIDPPSFSLQVVSNEPAEGDILVTGGAVSVRAERSGAGAGREYDIEASVRDRAGNVNRAGATCVVPHDRSR